MTTPVESGEPPPEDESRAAPDAATVAGVPGQGYHRETLSGQPVKEADVASEQSAFLGGGPHSMTHPRTGRPDPSRRASADGRRSIRYGGHEKASAGTSKHHYHEETWSYDGEAHVMNVDSVVRRIQSPAQAKAGDES